MLTHKFIQNLSFRLPRHPHICIRLHRPYYLRIGPASPDSNLGRRLWRNSQLLNSLVYVAKLICIFTFGAFSIKAHAETTPNPMMEVTWENYYQTAEILIQKIEESDWEFDHIICIARGGMPVGDMLSRVFKKPLAIILASSYKGEKGMNQKQLVISEIATVSGLSKKVLLIDDLADSGQTLRAIKAHLLAKFPEIEEVRTAVLWYKTGSEFAPDYFSEYVDKSTWIIQPFERYDHFTLTELAGSRVD